jgi:hypothetical protein
LFKGFSLTIKLDRAQGLVMSEQAEKFLAQWEFEHIADSDIVARSVREDQARRLALQCWEDAAKAGINSQDLEAAAEGNLIGNILQALDAAEFRQMYRDQLADQEEDWRPCALGRQCWGFGLRSTVPHDVLLQGASKWARLFLHRHLAQAQGYHRLLTRSHANSAPKIRLATMAFRKARDGSLSPRAMLTWLVTTMQVVSAIQSQSQNIPAPS